MAALEDFNWNASADRAEMLMSEMYPDMLEAGFDFANTKLAFEVDFDLRNPEVQKTRDMLARQVRGIADTTRQEIADLILRERADGKDPTPQEVAKRILEHGAVASKSRAQTIAVTEMARAASQGALLAYKNSGVVEQTEWIVTDPCPICAPLAGKKAALGKTFADGIDAPPAHPHCRCALVPVVEDVEAQEPHNIPMTPEDTLRAHMDEMRAMGLVGDDDYNWVMEQLRKGGYSEAELRQEIALVAKDLAKEYNKRAVVPRYIEDARAVDTDYRVAQANREQWKVWHDGLTDEQREALMYYKSNDLNASSINNPLRRGTAPPADKVAAIDQAFEGMGLKEPAVVHRGLGFGITTPPPEFVNLRPGSIIPDRAFMSTAMRGEVVDKFGGQYHFEIYVPAGTPAIPMDFFTGGNTKLIESELLLPRGTHLVVHKVETESLGGFSDARINVVAEVVPDA